MAKILSKAMLAPGLVQMQIEAPRVAHKAMPGQFIILRPTPDGERIPLTIANADVGEGVITIIFQEVGASTKMLSQLPVGDEVADFAGPLGQPSHFGDAKRVLCIGGGVGTAVLYPQVQHLYKAGIGVDVIIGARNKELMIMEKELGAMCDTLYLTTDDGSYMRKGFVTDVLKELIDKGEKYDLVVAIGPPVMMRAVVNITKPLDIKTLVSLNPIMVDGTGMCGCCRVTVGGQTKYACVDGPDFDGFEVDFDEMILRSRIYLDEEQALLNKHIHAHEGGAQHG